MRATCSIRITLLLCLMLADREQYTQDNRAYGGTPSKGANDTLTVALSAPSLLSPSADARLVPLNLYSTCRVERKERHGTMTILECYHHIKLTV